MTKTVFILGAGASVAAGVPMMDNFLDVARELLTNGSAAEFEESFKAVFEGISRLQSVHSKSQLDIQNVESVFASFEMAKIVSRFGEYKPDQIEALAKAMNSLIVGTIQETFKIPYSNHSITAPYPYPDFAKLIHELLTDLKHKVAILTFNYDMGLDLAFTLLRTPIRYGLQADEHSDALPLLKLHGSLNWAQCLTCGEIVPWYLFDYFSKYKLTPVGPETRYVRMNIASHLNNFKHGEHPVSNIPMIVPPTWNKSQYHSTISRVWSEAAQELSDAENIFIIGYSLPESDSFFRLLYALGTVGSTPLNRFWVINPDVSGRVEERFRRILGPGAIQRFQYIQLNFDQSLNDILVELKKSRSYSLGYN